MNKTPDSEPSENGVFSSCGEMVNGIAAQDIWESSAVPFPCIRRRAAMDQTAQTWTAGRSETG